MLGCCQQCTDISSLHNIATRTLITLAAPSATPEYGVGQPSIHEVHKMTNRLINLCC
jgi:hypothetical protein